MMASSLTLYPLAAVAGALVGSALHEASHAAVAAAFGVLDGAGWQGGLTGGPYVDFRPETRLQSEAVRKAPLVVGVVGSGALVAAYDGPTVAWVGAAAAVVSVLRLSPEDLSIRRARQPPPADED